MKNFSEDDIRTVWLAVKKGMRKSKVAVLMSCTLEEAQYLYDEACKRWSTATKKENEINEPVAEEKIVYKPIQQTNERPKAEYSNSSPYRIAREGI